VLAFRKLEGLFTMSGLLLRPEAITEVLDQTNVEGIKTTMCARAAGAPSDRASVSLDTRRGSRTFPPSACCRLVNRKGELVAFRGQHSLTQAIKYGAIACNVWHLHSSPAEKFAGVGLLRCLVFDLESGKLVVVPSADHLVVCHAGADAPLGFVKAKTQAVAQHLQHALLVVTQL
jgi:hypothetical protein